MRPGVFTVFWRNDISGKYIQSTWLKDCLLEQVDYSFVGKAKDVLFFMVSNMKDVFTF